MIDSLPEARITAALLSKAGKVGKSGEGWEVRGRMGSTKLLVTEAN